MASGNFNDDEFNFSAEMLRKLGSRLRAIRKAKGFSNYEDFANAYHINRVQYGRYENGENLNFTTLTKLVYAFGMTLGEFFGEGF